MDGGGGAIEDSSLEPERNCGEVCSVVVTAPVVLVLTRYEVLFPQDLINRWHFRG